MTVTVTVTATATVVIVIVIVITVTITVIVIVILMLCRICILGVYKIRGPYFGSRHRKNNCMLGSVSVPPIFMERPMKAKTKKT